MRKLGDLCEKLGDLRVKINPDSALDVFEIDAQCGSPRGIGDFMLMTNPG
ncbi:MAG: hypothetical protein ABIV48_09240 [Pyrinomonadaceae bacterium]